MGDFRRCAQWLPVLAVAHENVKHRLDIVRAKPKLLTSNRFVGVRCCVLALRECQARS